MAVTEANAMTVFKDVVKILNEGYKFANANVTNYLALEAQLAADVPTGGTDFVAEILDGAANVRARLDEYLRESSGAFLACLRQLGTVVGSAEGDAAALLSRIYDSFVASGHTIRSRQFAFGTPAAGGSNVGSGTLYRLNVDENGYPVENQHAELKTVQCTQDQTTGVNAGEEVFEYRGTAAFKDALNLTGSGPANVKSYPAISAAGSLLANASFSQFSPSATAPTSVANWDFSPALVGDGSDVKLLTGVAENGGYNYFRGYPGDPGPYGMALYVSKTISQTLTLNAKNFSPFQPYFHTIRWRADPTASAAVGTLTFSLGSQVTPTVTVSGQTGWQSLRLPVDKNLFYKNWSQNLPKVVITWTRSSGGPIIVDDNQTAPFQPFDGGWYYMDGGATPAMRNDVFTFTDACVDAILQRWLFLAYGTFWPSLLPPPATSGTTIQSGTAGSITVGNHKFAWAFEDIGGNLSALGPDTGNVAFDGSHSASGTVAPIGPTGTAARRLFMTTAGASTFFYSTIRIADNTTTAWGPLSIADGSLTVAAPAGITYDDP